MDYSPPRSSSDIIVLMNSLPPPGPDHYHARRALWLTPPPNPNPSRQPPPPHARLERLLSQPDAVHSDRVWKHGIDRVWKGLINGNRLKQRLPLSVVIKVIHAGWLRDPDTWPEGAVVPDSDDPQTVATSTTSPSCTGCSLSKPP